MNVKQTVGDKLTSRCRKILLIQIKTDCYLTLMLSEEMGSASDLRGKGNNLLPVCRDPF